MAGAGQIADLDIIPVGSGQKAKRRYGIAVRGVPAVAPFLEPFVLRHPCIPLPTFDGHRMVYFEIQTIQHAGGRIKALVTVFLFGGRGDDRQGMFKRAWSRLAEIF